MLAFRVDRGRLEHAREDHNGNFIVTGAITRTGVYTYKHVDKDGKVFTTEELRHPDDVYDAKSIASFTQLPLTDEHPLEGRVTPENVKRLSVGNLGDTITRGDKDYVMADLIIRDATAIAKVRAMDGGKPKRELSCGYSAEVTPEKGMYQGQHYDHRQRNIRGNHVALVSKGRGGPEVRLLLDAADAILDDPYWVEDEESGTKDVEKQTPARVIGRTSTGKTVYSDHSHVDHEKFNKQEHQEASQHHRRETRHASDAADFFAGISHPTASGASSFALDMAKHHTQQASLHVKSSNKVREDNMSNTIVMMRNDVGSGAGSRGGKVIGRTKSGKPIYMNHNHPSHGDFGALEHLTAKRVHSVAMAKLKSQKEQMRKEGKSIATLKNKVSRPHQEDLKKIKGINEDIEKHSAAVGFHERKSTSAFRGGRRHFAAK